MLRYSLKRFFLSLPLVLAMSFVTFLFIQFAPGNFLDSLKLNPQLNPQTLKVYAEKFHLDKPVLVQYLAWLKNLLKGELGYSFTYQAEVKRVILSRAGNTLILSLAVLIFSWSLGIPLGVLALRYRKSFIERLLNLFSYIGISTPSFFLAFLLLYFAYLTRLFPLGAKTAVNFEELSYIGKLLDIFRHLFLPVLAISLPRIASLYKLMRANLLEIWGSNFILALKARGISKRRIHLHALRNALNPLITLFGYELSSLLSGAALVEIIFGWPGLGQVILEAVQKQDLYLVMSAVLMSGVFLITGNLIADILLGIFDPRIRYGE